jgi:hypothetical protein
MDDYITKGECYIHSLKQGEKNVLGEATIIKKLGEPLMYERERVTVSGDFRFIVVKRCAVLIDDFVNTLFARDNALNLVRPFNGLHFGDAFKPCEHSLIALPAFGFTLTQFGYSRHDIDKPRREHSVFQKGVIKVSHIKPPSSYLHIV